MGRIIVPSGGKLSLNDFGVPVAEAVNEHETSLAALAALDDAWPTYTMGIVASAGTFALGTGGGAQAVGRYTEIGRLCILTGNVQIGTSGFNAGTAGAYWRFPLPAGHVTTSGFTGSAKVTDVTFLEWGAYCAIDPGGSYVELFKPVSGRFKNNDPFTIGASDTIWFTIMYEKTT